MCCCVYIAVGSAGHRFGHGEERNGAQTCHYSTEGEQIHLHLIISSSVPFPRILTQILPLFSFVTDIFLLCLSILRIMLNLYPVSTVMALPFYLVCINITLERGGLTRQNVKQKMCTCLCYIWLPQFVLFVCSGFVQSASSPYQKRMVFCISTHLLGSWPSRYKHTRTH